MGSLTSSPEGLPPAACSHPPQPLPTEDTLRDRTLAPDHGITVFDKALATKESEFNLLPRRIYHLTPVEIAMADGE